MNVFHNPAGKIYEVKDFCALCWIASGFLVVLAGILFPPQAFIAFLLKFITGVLSLADSNEDVFSAFNLAKEIADKNLLAAINFLNGNNKDSESGLIILVIFAIGFGVIFFGLWSLRKNQKYIVNSKNNKFYIPLKNEPYCDLSDIDVLNKRVDSVKERKSFYENGKQKYRTVTKYFYYIDILGADFSRELSFSSQGRRDKVYSCLKLGIKSAKEHLAAN